MNNYYLIGIGFGILIVVRFLLNISKYYYLKKVVNKRKIYIDGRFEDSNEGLKKYSDSAASWIQENQIEIRKIVLATGIQDQRKSFMAHLGFGYTERQSMTALDNLLLLDIELFHGAAEIINRAKGFYKTQAIKCFNPLFWIEFIIFLPKEILKYFGVNENEKIGSTITKIIQIIYWLASLFFMYQKYKNGV